MFQRALLAIIFTVFFACDPGGGGNLATRGTSNLPTQPNYGDAQGSFQPQSFQQPQSNGQQQDPPSMFGSGSDRATFAQCGDKNLVWVAVDSASGGIPICGGAPSNFGCCIDSIAARFPVFSSQARNFHNQKVAAGFELYACETNGDQQKFHYAKKGSADASIEYEYMNFALAPQQVSQSFSNCPNKPEPSQALMAAILKYQTPLSFDDSVSNSIPDPDSDGNLTEEEDTSRINYPVYFLNAAGTMRHRRGQVAVVAKVEMSSDKTSFYFDQKGTRAVSGDYEDRVNRKIGSANGKRVGQRASRDKVRNLEANNLDFINANFIVFTESIKNQSGKEYTFAPFAPGVIVPATASRYDVFYGIPELVYDIAVTGHKSFQMKTTVTRESNNGSTVVIKIKNEINDPSGQTYQDFPLPAESTYEIDTNRKVITKITTKEYYHDPEGSGNKRYETTTTATTCKIVTGDKTTDFVPCK